MCATGSYRAGTRTHQKMKPAFSAIAVACFLSLFFVLLAPGAFAQTACTPNPCQNGGVCSLGSGSSYVCTCPLDVSGTNCTDPIPQRLIHVAFDSGVVRDRMGAINLTLNEEGAGQYLTAPWREQLVPLQQPRYFVRPARVPLLSGSTIVRTPHALSLDRLGPAFVATNPVLRWGANRNFTIGFYRLQGSGSGYNTDPSGYFFFALNPNGTNHPSAMIRKEDSTASQPLFITGVPSSQVSLGTGGAWIFSVVSFSTNLAGTCRARRYAYATSSDSVLLQIDQTETCPSLTSEFPNGVGISIGGRPSFNDTVNPFRVTGMTSARGNMNPKFEIAEFQVFESELTLSQIAQVGREFLKAPRNACNRTCANNGVCIWAEETMLCSCQPPWFGANCTQSTLCNPSPCQNGGNCTVVGLGYTCSCPLDISGTNCTDFIPQRLIHVTFDSGVVRDRIGSVNLTLDEEGAGLYTTAPWREQLPAPLQQPRYFVRPARLPLTTGSTVVRTPNVYSLDRRSAAFVTTNPVMRWGTSKNFTIGFYRLLRSGYNVTNMPSGYFWYALSPTENPYHPSSWFDAPTSTQSNVAIRFGYPRSSISPVTIDRWVFSLVTWGFQLDGSVVLRVISYFPDTDSTVINAQHLVGVWPVLTAAFPSGTGISIAGRPSFNNTFNPFSYTASGASADSYNTDAVPRGNMNPEFEMAEFQVWEQELSLSQIAQAGREFLKAPRNQCNLTCANNGTCIWAEEVMQCSCASGWTGPACTTPCPLGFDGPNCANNINDCCPMPCFNGGTCRDGIASYTCQCPPFYSGTRCEKYDYCNAQAPCLNGGSCSQPL